MLEARQNLGESIVRNMSRSTILKNCMWQEIETKFGWCSLRRPYETFTIVARSHLLIAASCCCNSFPSNTPTGTSIKEWQVAGSRCSSRQHKTRPGYTLCGKQGAQEEYTSGRSAKTDVNPKTCLHPSYTKNSPLCSLYEANS